MGLDGRFLQQPTLTQPVIELQPTQPLTIEFALFIDVSGFRVASSLAALLFRVCGMDIGQVQSVPFTQVRHGPAHDVLSTCPGLWFSKSPVTVCLP